MNTAVEDGLITANPCRVKGGGSASTRKTVLPPTDEELADIINHIAPSYAALVVLAANGGLRFGEATELRRKDLTEHDAVVRVSVSRAVVHTQAQGFVVGRPKSEAGTRKIGIFGVDAQLVKDHLAIYTGRFGESLLFPASDGVRHLAQSSFFKEWNRTRAAAGRPDMPFHALRHYAGTRYAQAGATPRETMARLGHSSMNAAMRYQHAGNRDDDIAARMARR